MECGMEYGIWNGMEWIVILLHSTLHWLYIVIHLTPHFALVSSVSFLYDYIHVTYDDICKAITLKFLSTCITTFTMKHAYDNLVHVLCIIIMQPHYY